MGGVGGGRYFHASKMASARVMTIARKTESCAMPA
jgi:hypothetical protein